MREGEREREREREKDIYIDRNREYIESRQQKKIEQLEGRKRGSECD